jgi:tetratricopeptide (TPR) repeat protein
MLRPPAAAMCRPATFLGASQMTPVHNSPARPVARIRAVFALVLMLAGIGFGGGGCAQQRPLPVVRQDGDHAFEYKNYDVALSNYEEYVDRRPHDAEGQYDLGKTLLVLNRADAAREHMSVAHDLAPQNDEYLDGLAAALVENHEGASASNLLRGQAESTGRVEDYIRWGKFVAKAGDPDEAERALKTAAKLDRGQHKEPQLALADFYAGMGDKKSALMRLRMAMYVAPKDPKVWDKISALGEIPGPSLAVQPEEVE